MLEGLAAWVLNTYVGEYVENLNTAQLSIALLQGAVELENLPLKKDALKSLDIPIEVKSGFIGKIRLNIPLRRLRSEPWVISIEKLYLVAGPLSKLQYDKEQEKQNEEAEKKVMLEALEVKWKALRHNTVVDSSNSSWFSYGASMAANVLENIQLKVKDVHIRYEDGTLNPQCPFAVGIVIKNLSAQSTDASWIPKFVGQNEADKMFKLVDLQDFGLYCDANASMLGTLSMAELADELEREMFRTTTNQFQEHNYILKPITAQAKVTRNMSALPLRLSSTPRIQLGLVLEELPLTLKTEQFQSLSLWQREFSRHGIRRKFRHCRPSTNVLESPRDWWWFAQDCHLQRIKDRNHRFTKAFLVERAHSVASYISIYSSHLKGETLTFQQKTTKSSVEEELTFDELKPIREAVMYRLHKGYEAATSSRKSPTHSTQESSLPQSLSPSSSSSSSLSSAVMAATTTTTTTDPPPQPPPLSLAPAPPIQSGSLFQRWFPGWSGWTSQASPQHPPNPSIVSSSSSSSSSQDLSLSDSANNPQGSGISHSVSTSTLTEGDGIWDEEEGRAVSPNAIATEDEIEQEIQDVIKDSWENSSFLRKDTVFASATFTLKKASFRLIETKQIEQGSVSSFPLVDLQCTDIGIEFESRPRTSAMKFSLTLGGLLVVDQTASNPIFSHVICPQSKDPHSRSVFNPAFHQTTGRSIDPHTQQEKREKDSDFFKLGFEKNLHQVFKYRVTVNTQPLDIIYSPELLHRVKAMFTLPTSGSHRSAQSVSQWQFEKLRKQTQEELKNTLDQLLEGKASRWGINLDISAPKFIITENMTESNPQLLVLDLGNFRLKTVSRMSPASPEQEKVKEEDEDKFETPLSTPPNETEEDKEVKQTFAQNGGLPSNQLVGPSNKPGSPENLSDAVFRNRLYEKYAIDLTEMQVLVGHLHDNWRHAYARGINLMHIVDRFSISIQLERRLIVTADPQWPTAKISGNLPSLTFHLNERKIQALQDCMERLSDHPAGPNTPHLSSNPSSFPSRDSAYGPSFSELSSAHRPDLLLEPRREVGEDNKLVVMQFLVNSLKVEVESQGKALIELQVTGVKLDVQNKPLNQSLVLTVHSLLLVDALQTYGRDFELLVASHKNVILDSRSGSIRGSKINSPMSPMSPSSPASPSSPTPDFYNTPSISFTSFQSIQDAISNAFHAVMPNAHHSGHQEEDSHEGDFNTSTFNQSRALILLDYEVITTPGSSAADGQTDETNRILRLQFNSLDFIANQETLMEIMGFVNRVFPVSRQKDRRVQQTSVETTTDLEPQHKNIKDTLHVNADFKRLNVMMLHFQKTNEKKEARKVATATMSCARLEAILEDCWKVEGSLGGFHLLDVTPEEKNFYQHIISIGQFQHVELEEDSSAGPPSVIPLANHPFDQSSFPVHDEDGKKACTFVIKKSSTTGEEGHSSNDDSRFSVDFSMDCEGEILTGSANALPKTLDAKVDDEIVASFDMASLCFIHSPKFLDELVDCVSEFQDYVTTWADSIKTAAAEVAMGMVVGVRGDNKDASVFNFSSATTSAGLVDSITVTSTPVSKFAMRKECSIGDITSTVLLEDVGEGGGGGEAADADGGGGSSGAGVLINVKMESPILIIPCTKDNPQVLLAHLGEIVIDNSSMCENTPSSRGSGGQFAGDTQDLINISLTNMNLFSVQLPLDMAFPVVNCLSAHLSEITQKSGVPILYDTSVDLVIGKQGIDIPFINPDVSEAISGLSNLAGLGSPPKKFSPEKDTTTDTRLVTPLSSILKVRAKISSPLMLKLSKEVYEQILQTTDNLTYDKDVSPMAGAGPSSPLPSTIPVPHMAPSGGQNNGGGQNTNVFVAESQAMGEVETFLAKHVEFDVPLFQVELRWDFGEGEQGLVELNLHDFSLQFEKNDKATTKINVRLKSLQMDDLLEPVDSKHRQIIVSHPSQAKERMEREHLNPKGMLSTSCPDSTIIAPIPQMPPSLPSSFSSKHPHITTTPRQPKPPQQVPLQSQHRSASKSQRWFTSESPQSYPCTPPPSPLAKDLSGQHAAATDKREDDLVQINVILVDKKRPEYFTQFNKTNRFIDINFACLDATINLQTWVVLLDFLGLGAKVHDVGSQGSEFAQSQRVDGESKGNGEKDNVNSDINFKVESFTLILNKPEYELAHATAANLHAHLDLRDGNLWATGELGSLSLLDQSPHGHLYRQRFMSVGRQLVEFDLFKYGLPDFSNQRECDISLKLRMSSVRYIHTNRFQSEMVAFIQHFLQLQDVLGRMRAASDGKKLNVKATRGARIKLDIEAASPILLIPHSSETSGVLVADLGNLKLNNCFIFDGEEGTLRAAAKARDATASKQSAATMKDSSAFQKGIIHRGMTESQLNMSYPPTRPVDPMSQSIYGSLDHDARMDDLEPGFGNAGGRTMRRHLSESSIMGRMQVGSRVASAVKQPNTSLSERDETKEGSDDDYRCLLDIISVTLKDMDLFTARRVWKSDYKGGNLCTDMEFSSFVLEREHGRLLEEKCHLELHIEHNLEGDVSHNAPDFSIKGRLSSVNCRLDGGQYELVRGILNHNLGEKLEEFRRPLMSHLMDPKIETVLSGNPWKVITLVLDLQDVTVELLHNHELDLRTPEKSLGRLDFISSQLSFSISSNQLREVGLVSNEILIFDTRFKNEPVNYRPNVFNRILQPSTGSKGYQGLQVEMQLLMAPDSTHFTCMLNNMRLMCIFDWLLAMQEFIVKEPPNPFQAQKAINQTTMQQSEMAEPTPMNSGSRNQSPLTVSKGVITKRGPWVEERKLPFELVLNFTDTQFVVVENSSSLDTNAVILKNTAVIKYKPEAPTKVLTCSLQNVELFSCCLMAEEETALSIVDPTGINVELNANPLPQPNTSGQFSGLLGLKDANRRQLVLEVDLKTLNIRVSYHDIVMFLAILNSLPQQAAHAQQHQDASNNTNNTHPHSKSLHTHNAVTASLHTDATPESLEDKGDGFVGGVLRTCVGKKQEKEEEVIKLVDMGFSEGDVRKALAFVSWNLEEAAVWLTENARVMAKSTLASPDQPQKKKTDFTITSAEMKADSIVLCLIDDCGDADIPLVELSCNALKIEQELEPSVEGKASFQLLAEYYNRKLSGWEPCLEPWKCTTEWKQYLKPEKKMAVQILACDVLNVNVTSPLIELYNQTKGTWTQDYSAQKHSKGTRGQQHPIADVHGDNNSSATLAGTVGGANSVVTPLYKQLSQSGHRRSPFIPYAIRNDTGCDLNFLTSSTAPSYLSGDSSTFQALESVYSFASEWERVKSGETKPFHFHPREKLRHQKTHTMHINQLHVVVEGWERLSPISMDKVGVYFRHAEPGMKALPHTPPARIVFEVRQEGSAKKLIIVRSSLVIRNRLDSPVELRMDSPDGSGQYLCTEIPKGQSIHIPLPYIYWRLRARPSDMQVQFSTQNLEWKHVNRIGDKPQGIHTCDFLNRSYGIYRFFVCITRQKFPEEKYHMSGSSSSPTLSTPMSMQSPHLGQVIRSPLPGHILTLLPPLTIKNFLPLELHYYLRGTGVSGNLKAGKEAALHGVNMSENFDLGIHLENFRNCKELTIPPSTRNCKVMLRIYDNKNRLLKLIVRISIFKGGAMKINILAPYWLVNKTGLPMIFRQDGARNFAAGQFEEHEKARSVTPLLFSFPEVEEQLLCQMRIGTELHGKLSKPQWSSRFSLEGGTSKKSLRVLNVESNRPLWVYTIGIQVTPGRGHYRGTNIVTFAPRFELDNLSRYKLAIAQLFMTKKDAKMVNADHFTAFPDSKLPFHWPRDDLDQLLCVKVLDIDGCRWSGGFNIDKINSFHINMRDASENCHLLKVEVVQEGPTFFIVFANADVMPPPFRINNLSDMQVRFQQKGTVDRYFTIIQPQTSIPYAWDEPTVKPLQLTLSIKGGTTASYSLNKLEEGEKLHYENFIYLAATATFDKNWTGLCCELVLDCIDGHTIVFKRQEKGKRNQLWRMTGTGMLEHEGSTSPRDPNRPQSSQSGLVLDMEDLAPCPGKLVPLILRKPDKLRQSTQRWRFTEQGVLCCEAGNLCVQAVGGPKGLFDGAKAVLGPGPNYKEAVSERKQISDFTQTQRHQQQQQQQHAQQSLMTSSVPSYSNTALSRPSQRSTFQDTMLSSLPSPSLEAHTPLHMLISRQKLHPGSGCISVRVVMDGPVRVLELVDITERQVVKRLTREKDLQEWEVYDELKGQTEERNIKKSSASKYSIELSVTLKNGIGVSLVNSQSEELIYVTLKNITVEVNVQPTYITFDANVVSIQVNNQILGAQIPVVLYTMTRTDVPDNTPALNISAHKVPSGEWKAEIFKHMFISTKRTTINLEEQLLWKLMQMAGVGKDEDPTSHCLDQTHEGHRALSSVAAIQGTRYYFGTVKLSVSRVTLSMVTSGKLTPDLKAIKNALSIHLLAFEQANIDMHSFEQHHVFETGPFLLSELKNHFTDELKGQAAKILGSVDFLGNPLGLFLDITEGITGFVKDGNVSGLLKNVTHGFSNTTAKVVSSLSDGISTVSLDDDHNQMREALRSTTSGSSSEHLMAGIKGFSHGILGGVTSLFLQSKAGVQNEGIGGLIKGVGKGVIGTVTKPVSGVLDLTSGLANALRDSSTRTSHRGPKRLREPRCTQGPGGLLPLYSSVQADAQTRLHRLNNEDYTECLVAMEQLDYSSSGEANIDALISNRRVYFVNQHTIILQIDHASISECCSISADGKYFVELTRRTNVNDFSSLNKPRVRCEKQSISKKVAQEIKYAKNLFDERAQTLDDDSSSDEEDN